MIELELSRHGIRLIIVSAVILALSVIQEIRKHSSDWPRGFWRMAGGWSVIDIVIAIVSLRSQPPSDLPALIRFLELNDCLNIAYVVCGALMAWRSTKAWINGMGMAIVLQGRVLLMLDSYLLIHLKANLTLG